jgi:hypothetical protein
MNERLQKKTRFQIDLDQEIAQKLEKEARTKHATNRKKWAEHVLTEYAKNL